MRILRIRAHDFGKLNGALDLAPGMTVVHGGNEAGKSTWLQAIFAGLCGRRRGRGANTLEDREFERQFEPWNGKPWRATIKFQLDDGRRIEIQQTDLKTKESSAHDAETGRPLGDEIIYRGSIDGSRFLGLNRQVVPSTLVIGQGDIQRLRQKSEKKGDEASALKEELQRAAASAGGVATAAEALRILKNYARNEIGTERRNSTKPLQRATERTALAAKSLEAGREHHKERNQLENRLSAARDRALRAKGEFRRCEQLRTERELERLDARLAEIERLEGLFPDGGPPPAPGKGPDADKARELREAAFEYRRRPEPPAELQGPGTGDMARELAELPEAREGDREVAPEVAAAARKWRESREARAVRERLGPGDPPDTRITGADEAAARRALAVLELPEVESLDRLEQHVLELREERSRYTRQLEANSGFGKWPWHGAFAGSLLGVLAMLDLLPRVVGGAGVLLALVSSLLIYRAQRRTPRPDSVAGPVELAQENQELADAEADLRDLKRKRKTRWRQTEAAARDLESLGLEPDADVVRAALDALRKREVWDWEHASWQQRVAAARQDEAAAEEALRAALRGRSVEDPEAPVAALFDRYERECRQNLALATGTDRREALNARMEARQQVERASARQREHREAAEARFRAALLAADYPADSTTDPDQWVADWLERRELRLGRLQSDWRRLQRLMDGRNHEEIAAERGSTAARLSALASAEIDDAPELQGLSNDALERKLAEARSVAADAGNEVSNYLGRLDADADLPSLAELEEEQAAADREVEILRRSGRILDTAQQHLKEAQDEVHRMLAPDLRQGLEERLSRVTAGHYSRARVDPEQGLEVQLEVEDGDYRSASELSYGTIDQVYLLLRIALAEALGNKKESAPLFLDDATVHCDTDRTIRFLSLLLTLSEERQIVVFSQEEEVRHWAEGRLVGDARHRLIELDRQGRPVGPNGTGEAGLSNGGPGPAPDPERQHSLL